MHSLFSKVGFALALICQYFTCAASAITPGSAAISGKKAPCSRVIQVPVAAVGLTLMVEGEKISGIYADALREIKKEGCHLKLISVPRARLEAMFEAGTADLLFPSNKTAHRDALGVFVPMIQNRATLISLTSNQLNIRSSQDLLANKEVRVILVRGYDYGPAYQKLMTELTKQGRLFLDADVISVARMLKTSEKYLTIMAPNTFLGAIHDDARVQDLGGKLSFTPIDELPWSDTGMYISKKSLNEGDRLKLQTALHRYAKSGAILKKFQHYFPPDALRESLSALHASH
jgi:polar amino acid transport system substrate-binding protein